MNNFSSTTTVTSPDILAESTQYSTSEQAIKKQILLAHFARGTQFLIWPIVFLVFSCIFSIRISGQKNIAKTPKSFILISNHIAFYDSFLLRLALGLWSKHLPLRFMAVKEFNSWGLNFLSTIGIIDLLYLVFGVFVVTPGAGIEKNLQTARDITMSGGNVVIYPEGDIVRLTDTIAPFRRGAAVLVKHTNAAVVPLSFRISGRCGALGLFRHKLYINIGEALTVSSTLSENETTAFFYEKVKGLYENRS